MKYGNTSRTLSLIFHALIAAAFGVMGLYYGIFVTPLYWTPNQIAFTDEKIFAFNFNLELAALGLALMIISIYGLVQAAKAVLEPNSDEHIIKSFVAFIVEGYIGAGFCLANACIYFDLLSFSSIPFIVVIGLLLAIVLLIATNIPMVRIFDGRDSNPLLAGLNYGAGTFLGILGLEILASLFGLWSRGSNLLPSSFQVVSALGASCLAVLIAAGLTIAGGVVIQKKKGAKPLTVSGYLDSAAIMLVGGAVIGNGVFDLYFKDSPNVHFESSTLAFTGLAYPICAIIFGAIIFAAGIVFLIMNGKDSKKVVAAPAAK